MNKQNDEQCPKCNVGFLQRTWVGLEFGGEAIGCNNCDYADAQPGLQELTLSYDPLAVDEGWGCHMHRSSNEKLSFLMGERVRLIEKLKKIENLSRYAWIQVRSKPDEAEELFKMIYHLSK